MGTLAKEIVDSYGPLTEVRGCVQAGVTGLATLALGFERGAVLIEAVGADDTIRLRAVPEVEGDVLSQEAPWREAIGRGVVWVWALTNQQGYRDGNQFEFGQSAQRDQATQLCIQVVVAASALRVSTVNAWG